MRLYRNPSREFPLSRTRSLATLDRVGRILSTTCAAHRLLMPLLVASVSLGAFGWLAVERTETALLLMTTTLAVVALGWGWNVHRRHESLGLLAVGLASIGAGRFLAPEKAETPMVVAGGVLFAAAHLVNSRLSRAGKGCRPAIGAGHSPENIGVPETFGPGLARFGKEHRGDRS
jgi:drug/metabolite transporter (DMT)-like permease